MMFITVGTEKFPFDRLIETIDKAITIGEIKDEVFAQIGSSTYIPKFIKYEKFLTFDEMIKTIRKADIVVSHAGVGSLLICLQMGKMPIIFPRLSRFGEHVDDHQLEFAKRIDVLKKALVAYDEDDLLYKIKNYRQLVTKYKAKTSFSKKSLIFSLLNSLKQKVD